PVIARLAEKTGEALDKRADTAAPNETVLMIFCVDFFFIINPSIKNTFNAKNKAQPHKKEQKQLLRKTTFAYKKLIKI
ncbi:MAG: hypothetical protein PV353_04840, partial [Bartonella sp.]|nr:hypothetical protein [Bartonella sp.]